MAQTKGTLYLIPTIIAEDTFDCLAPQVKEVSNALTYFLVENIRTARRFLSALGVERPIPELEFEELSKKTSEAEVEKLMQPLLKGQDVGVMSEAGCPGIADPGARAVAWAHRHSVKVVPLVGPSSIFLALMASGFSGQSFAFHGYLPIQPKERGAAIQSLEQQAGKLRQTQIFMETPYRNEKLFQQILKTCHPQTQLCIARGVTGSEEMIRTLSIAEWRKETPALHKVPTIFLLATP